MARNNSHRLNSDLWYFVRKHNYAVSGANQSGVCAAVSLSVIITACDVRGRNSTIREITCRSRCVALLWLRNGRDWPLLDKRWVTTRRIFSPSSESAHRRLVNTRRANERASERASDKTIAVFICTSLKLTGWLLGFMETLPPIVRWCMLGFLVWVPTFDSDIIRTEPNDLWFPWLKELLD